MKRLILVLVVCSVAVASTAGPIGPTDRSADGSATHTADARFRWFLWPLMEPGPLFTADWWKGIWGVQLTLQNLAVAGSSVDCEVNVAGVWRGVLTATVDSIGPTFSVSDVPAAATDIKVVTAAMEKRWQYLLRYQGLFPASGILPATNELSVGVAWKRDRRDVPWSGPVLSGVASAGAKGVHPYGFVQSVGSYYVQAEATPFVLVPTAIFATILGNPSGYPADRLLSDADGASLQTKELVGTLVDANDLCASFMGGCLSMRVPLATLITRASGEGIALFVGLSGWAAAENLIQRPAWLGVKPAGGVSCAVALVPTQTGRPNGSPVVVKLGSRFSELRSPSHWKLDIIFSTGVFPIGPQSGIDWYW